jgi:putative transposase
MSKNNKARVIPQPSKQQIDEAVNKAVASGDISEAQTILKQLMAPTIEALLKVELEDHLGYEKHSVEGYNTGNSRNGNYQRKLKSTIGQLDISVPRDRKGEFNSQLLRKYSSSSHGIEDKVVAMYARGMSTRDIADALQDIYGVNVSSTLISQMTQSVMPLVIEWQNRPLESIYPVCWIDCIHLKVRQDKQVKNVAVYIIIALTAEGRKDVLGHWVGTGGESAKYWLSVFTEIKNRGVTDILICSSDNLKGLSEALESIYPQTIIQKCIVHQIRNSLKFIPSKHTKEFLKDLKSVYKAETKDLAEQNLLQLASKWSDRYPMAIKTWEDNWSELSAYFEYPAEIRRIIYTTNTVEGYNRQIRKVIKAKSQFPTAESVEKILYLVYDNVSRKWTMPVRNWALVRNQLAIKFEGRFPTN